MCPSPHSRPVRAGGMPVQHMVHYENPNACNNPLPTMEDKISITCCLPAGSTVLIIIRNFPANSSNRNAHSSITTIMEARCWLAGNGMITKLTWMVCTRSYDVVIPSCMGCTLQGTALTTQWGYVAKTRAQPSDKTHPLPSSHSFSWSSRYIHCTIGSGARLNCIYSCQRGLT